MKLEIDLRGYQRGINRLGRDMQFAAAKALNDTAFAARGALRAEAERVFNRPREYTLRGFAVDKAAKEAVPAATVKILPQQARFLALEVFGGERRPGDYATLRRAGAVVPGAAEKVDAEGNLRKGRVGRLLRSAQARKSAPTVGKQRGQSMADRVFVGRVETARGSVYGLWLRPRRNRQGKDVGRPRAVAVFERSVGYKPRLDFYRVVREAAQRELPGNWRKAMAAALAGKRR